MSDDVNFLYAERKWIPVIGKFIIDFASIEDSLHHVVSYHLRDTYVQPNWFAEKIKEQIAIFKEVMLSEVLDAKEDEEKLNLLVSQILQLKQTRNLIAHNSLSLSFVEDEQGRISAAGFEIGGKRNINFSINYDQLVKEMKRLEKSRSQLHTFMLKFHEYEYKKVKAENSGIASLEAKK